MIDHAATQHAISRLEIVARDNSLLSRSKLLVAVSDLVCNDRSPSASEVRALCDVAGLLFTVADEDSRVHFASTIGPIETVPRDVILLLINDVALVATTIIRLSPVLTDDDLMTIVETRPDDYRIAIARRAHVGAQVVSKLVDSDSAAVHLALAENVNLILPQDAIQAMLAIAQSNEALCRCLVGRAEVPRSDAEQLVKMIAKMLQARFRTVMPRPPVKAIEPPKVWSPSKMPVPVMLEAIKAGRIKVDEAISELADDDRFNELGMFLSEVTRVEEVSITRLLVRADANGIAMICKALDVSDAAFASIVNLRRRRLKHSETHARFEREDYAKLSSEESKAMLQQLAVGRARS